MEIKIQNKDIIWSYIGQIFTFGTAALTLPPILKNLSPEEIGLNYLFQTIIAMVALFDFGFSPQFGRNITYVLGGAQTLKKDGIGIHQKEGATINYHLFKSLILAGKRVYAILAIVSFLFMLVFGTIYLYKVTDQFTLVANSFWIWLAFLTAVSINIFFNYYNPLLIGKGMIKENSQILIARGSIYIVLIYVLINFNFGLFSLVIGTFISTLFSRFLANKIYFTKTLRFALDPIKVINAEIKDTFLVVWYNSKKLGINFIGGFLIRQSGIFLAGIYLSLKDVANLGISTQLVAIAGAFASLMFNTYIPRFNYLRIINDKRKLINEFSKTLLLFYVLFFFAASILILAGNYILNDILGSEVHLIGTVLLIFYCVAYFLQSNYSFFASLIVTENKVPFVKSNLITGALVLIFTFLTLSFLNWGIFGIIISQLVAELLYNSWKWPHYICKDFRINYFQLLLSPFKNHPTTT